MPVDEGTRGYEPAVPRPKPKPIGKPDEGTRGLKPRPKPHPVLQKHFNFHGSVEDFNRRLEAIDKSHTGTLGYRPSGALAYDIAKSPVKDEQIPVLFQVPRTKKAAAAVSFVKKNPATGVLEQQTPFAEQIASSTPVDGPSYAEYTDEQLLDEMDATLKRSRAEFNRFYRANRERIDFLMGERSARGARAIETAQIQAQGITDGGPVTAAALLGVRGLMQVTGALVVGPPTLAYEEGKATKQSVEQRSLKPLGRANYKIAEAAVTGFYEDGKAVVTGDWEYIQENPGFIALDILGLGKVVGTAARLPAGGTRTLRHGGVEVEALRSENPAVALIQDKIRQRRQRAADRRLDSEEIIEHSKLGWFAQKNLGFERKVGRELERERKLNVALGDMVRQDLERVTGWSERAANARKAVGVKAHRGVTRGEQMALFIESLDVPGSFKDRAAALRKAHEGWLRDGLGDPAAHQQKLRDIQLAERAVRKPSPRFEKALGLTRAAVAEMEALKVRELGLDASVASGRVARAGEVVRTGEKLEDFDTPPRAREDSFYVPTVSPRQSRPLAKQPFRPKRFGHYGAAMPEMNRLVPELTHQFTGKAMQAGDYRIDTTRLVGEAVGRTVRAASILSQYRTLLKGATPTPRSEFDRPIRTSAGIPVQLRDIVNRTDEGELVGDEVNVLSKHDADEMLRELFPGQRGADGRWLVGKEIEGVKWIDERLIDPEAWTQPMPSKFVAAADAINSPFRFVTLYLRPAYILNLLGATGSAFIYQGLHAPPNIARAIFAGKLYGKKVENNLRDLVGGGRATSYVQGRPVTNTTKEVARFWNTITDERLRMSTAFYYGRKQNIKTRKDWENLLDGAKNGDDAAFKTLNEIVDRTKKAMVQFDNLTWAEQNLLRHAIFIYPWQRGAAVWSVRTLVERPVTSAVLAQIGRDAQDDIADVFTERIPGWFKNAGYLPFGYDDNGDPQIVNPASLNTFSTLNSLMHSRVDQLLGPAGELAVRGATERDEFGNEYPSTSRAGRWRDAALDVLGGLPQITAMEKSRRKEERLPAPDITDRGSLAKRVNDALAATVLSPGWLDGYGQLLTGAAGTPRSVNEEALLARWYRGATPEERVKLQKELVNKALGVQAEMLGRSVPMDVRRLVNLQFELDAAANARARELDRDITPMERTLIDIERLAPAKKAELVKQAERLSSDSEHTDFRRELFEEHADPDGLLRGWDDSVRRVNALATPRIVTERLRRLSENGVNDGAVTAGKLTRQQLVEYGRKADEYAREYKRRRLEIEQLRKTDPDQVAVAEAELVAWKSEQDQPVRVNGISLPSPARMEWAKEWNYEQRVDDVVALTKRDWRSLTRFERDLLGKKTDPVVLRGWQKLEQLKQEFLAGQPRGERSIPADFERQAARYINRTTPGFTQDFLYATEPLGVRLQTMRPVLTSPHRAEWQRLFVEVRPAIQALKNGAPKSHLRDSWKDYVNSSDFPTFSPAFRAELERFDIDPARDLF